MRVFPLIAVGAAAAAMAWCAAAGRATDPSDPHHGEVSMTDRLAEVEGRPFLKKNPWIRDWTKAKAEAARTGRLIFGLFIRSYSP